MLKREPSIFKQPNEKYAYYSKKEASFLIYNATELELVNFLMSEGETFFSIQSKYKYSMNYIGEKDGVIYKGDNLWRYFIKDSQNTEAEEIEKEFTKPYLESGVEAFRSIEVYIYPYYEESNASEKYRIFNSLTRESTGYKTEEECYEAFKSIWEDYLSEKVIKKHFEAMKDEMLIENVQYLIELNKVRD